MLLQKVIKLKLNFCIHNPWGFFIFVVVQLKYVVIKLRVINIAIEKNKEKDTYVGFKVYLYVIDNI